MPSIGWGHCLLKCSSISFDNVDLRGPAMAKIAIFAALVLKLPGGVGVYNLVVLNAHGALYTLN